MDFGLKNLFKDKDDHYEGHEEKAMGHG